MMLLEGEELGLSVGRAAPATPAPVEAACAVLAGLVERLEELVG